MTSHSKNIIERLKRTLFKFDLEIARVEGEISLLSERMDLLSESTKKKDLTNFTLSKIEKENYEVYLNRIKTAKTAIIARINLIVDKYEDGHSKVFQKRYFEGKDIEDIAVELEMPPSVVAKIVARLDEDILDYVSAR